MCKLPSSWPPAWDPRVCSGPDVAFPLQTLQRKSCRKNKLKKKKMPENDRHFLGLSSQAPSWRQDGRRCDLDRLWSSIWRPLGAYVGAKMAQVAPRSAKLGLSWRSNLASFAPREEFSIYTNSRSTAKRPLC